MVCRKRGIVFIEQKTGARCRPLYAYYIDGRWYWTIDIQYENTMCYGHFIFG